MSINYQFGKKFKSMIALFLVVIILVNVNVKIVHAEPFTITAVSLKVIAVVLTSMGVLNYVVQKEGSLSNFTDKFASYTEEKFNTDVFNMLYDIFVSSIKTKSKMLLSDILQYIKDFFAYEYDEVFIEPSVPDFGDYVLSDSIFSLSYNFYNGKSRDYSDFYINHFNVGRQPISGVNYYYFLDKNDFTLSDGRIFRVTYSYFVLPRSYALPNTRSFFKINRFDEIVGDSLFPIQLTDVNYTDPAWLENTFSRDADALIDVNTYLSVSSDYVKLTVVHSNSYNGFFSEDTVTYNIGNISSGKLDGTIVNSSPILKNIPSSGIAFPLNDVLNLNDYVGLPFQDILDRLANVPLNDFVSGLRDKAGVDGYPVTGVDVDEHGVVVDVDVPADIPDVNDGEGINIPILSDILRAINSILDFLKNMFNVSEFELDLSGFKSLIITEKFPFSIPFDFVNSIKMFAKQAKNPIFSINLDTHAFKLNHVIDLQPYIFYIGFFRYISVAWFSWFLIIKTKDLIKF